MQAGYLAAYANGRLEDLINTSGELLRKCTLCPRRCGVDRLGGERGYCLGAKQAEVASYGPHFGEESVLVGDGGSGTIFFCGCNLLCRFCQNWGISHRRDGDCREVAPHELAAVMIELQQMGCHNINFVTPSHVVPQILAALPAAIDGGLTLPLVYNCGGYESLDTLQLLDGIVDIYMPDCKFSSPASAKKYLRAADYPGIARQALREMQRQVGDLVVDDAGVAVRGVLVRHLLMPGGLPETKEILAFLSQEISPGCYVNIMDQYRPCGEAGSIPELSRGISPGMLAEANAYARDIGLTRLDNKDMAALLRHLFR